MIKQSDLKHGRAPNWSARMGVPSILTCAVTAAVAGVATAAVVVALAGCSLGAGAAGGSGPAASFAAVEAVAKTCPTVTVAGSAKPVAATPQVYVAADASGSFSAKASVAHSLAALHDITTWVDTCAGRLHISVFATSATDTATVLDQHFVATGATRTAQLRASMKTAAAAIQRIDAAYPAAVKQLADKGSDVVAQFTEAADYFAVVRATNPAGAAANQVDYLWILSDGMNNEGGLVLGSKLTVAQAVALAGRASLPNLAGVHVTIAGVGRLSDAKTVIPTSWTASLTAFYKRICQRAGVASCVVVSQYQPVAG